MAEYTREYCSVCGDKTVHKNYVCIRHEDKCDECGRVITNKEGRYRVEGGLVYCEKDGEDKLLPRGPTL